VDTIVSLSRRDFSLEVVPFATVSSPGATLFGEAAESCFFSSGSSEESKGAPGEEDRHTLTPEEILVKVSQLLGGSCVCAQLPDRHRLYFSRSFVFSSAEQ